MTTTEKTKKKRGRRYMGTQILNMVMELLSWIEMKMAQEVGKD